MAAGSPPRARGSGLADLEPELRVPQLDAIAVVELRRVDHRAVDHAPVGRAQILQHELVRDEQDPRVAAAEPLAVHDDVVARAAADHGLHPEREPLPDHRAAGAGAAARPAAGVAAGVPPLYMCAAFILWARSWSLSFCS